MANLLGPILSFRGCDNDIWQLTVIVVSKNGIPNLLVDNNAIAPTILWDHGKGTVYRYAISFAMGDAPVFSTYSVDGQTYEVAVPAKGQAPTMAYISCNGYSSAALARNDTDKFRVWRALARKHGLASAISAAYSDDDTLKHLEYKSPYHLLLCGGDQIYADGMKESIRAMRDWFAKSWDTANTAKLTATMVRQLDEYYFDLYVREWSKPEVAQILARVPTIAMWDDHDLIDGWGSYEPERQNCEVFGGIWAAAARAFSVFQQHIKPNEFRPGSIHTSGVPANWWQDQLPVDAGQEQRLGTFSFAYIVGNIAIVVPDLRSQRNLATQVMNRQDWDNIFEWILAYKDRFKHLLIMSSIPVMYPDFAFLESTLGWIPGHQDLEDDLRDHWSSVPHRGERARVVNRLFDFAKNHKLRGTILSGDVHVACTATINSNRDVSKGIDTEITQLVSSGVIHPGLGAIVLFALKNLFDQPQTIDDNAIGRMENFPSTQTKFVGTRNYLSLEPDRPGKGDRIWCNWVVENQPSVYTKVILPIA